MANLGGEGFLRVGADQGFVQLQERAEVLKLEAATGTVDSAKVVQQLDEILTVLRRHGALIRVDRIVGVLALLAAVFFGLWAIVSLSVGLISTVVLFVLLAVLYLVPSKRRASG